MADNTEQLKIQVQIAGVEQATAALNELSVAARDFQRKLGGASTNSAGFNQGMAGIEASTKGASKAAQQLGGILGTLSGQLKLAAAITFTQAIGGQLASGLGVIRSGIISFNAILETAQVGLGTLIRNRAELDAYAAANIEIARTSANAAEAEQIRAKATKEYAVTQQEANNMAQQQVEMLREFANVTPFFFTGLTKTAVMMQAFGFRMEEILQKDSMGRFTGALVAIGDAVAALGGGDETITRIAYALGQMKSAGRVYQNDMMQLANAGIAGYQILGKALMDDLEKAGQQSSALYKSLVENPVEVIRQLAKQGKLSGEAAAEAILAGLNERYGGGMKRFQKTFQASLSTLSDTTQSLVAVAFKPLFYYVRDSMVNLATELQKPQVMQAAKQFMSIADGLVSILKMLAPIIKDVALSIAQKLNVAILNLNLDSMTGKANQLLSFIRTLGDALKTVADFLGSKFGQSITIAGVGIATFLKFLQANPVINFIVGVAAAIGILRKAYDENLWGLRDTLMPIIEMLTGQSAELGKNIQVLAQAFLSAFSETIVNVVVTLGNAIGGLVNVVSSVLKVFAPSADAAETFGKILGTLVALMVAKKVIIDGFAGSLLRLSTALRATGGKAGTGLASQLNSYFNIQRPKDLINPQAMTKAQAKQYAAMNPAQQARVRSLDSSYKALNGTLGKTASALGGVGAGMMGLGVVVSMVNPEMGGFLMAIGGLLTLVPAIVQGLVALRAAVAASGASLTAFLATPAGLALIAIGALTAGVAIFAIASRDATEKQRNLNEQFENIYKSAGNLVDVYDNLTASAERLWFLSGSDLWDISKVRAFNDALPVSSMERLDEIFTHFASEIDGLNWGQANKDAFAAWSGDIQNALISLSGMGKQLKDSITLQEQLNDDVDQFARLQELQALASATGIPYQDILKKGWYEIRDLVASIHPDWSAAQISAAASRIDALNDNLKDNEKAWLNATIALDPYLKKLAELTGMDTQSALDYLTAVGKLTQRIADLFDQNQQDQANAAYERKLKLLTNALNNATDAADRAKTAFSKLFDQFKFFYDQLVTQLQMVFQDKLAAQVEALKKQAEEAIRAIQVLNDGNLTTVGALRDQIAAMKEIIDDRERLNALQEASLNLQRAELGLYDASKDPFEAAIALREAAAGKQKAQEQYTIATMEDTLQGAEATIAAVQARYDQLLKQLQNDQALLSNQFSTYFSDYMDFIQAIADGEMTVAEANAKFLERYGVGNVFGKTTAEKALGWDNFIKGASNLFGIDIGQITSLTTTLNNFGSNFGDKFKTNAIGLANWLRTKWPGLMKAAITAATTAINVTTAQAALDALKPPTPKKAGPTELDEYQQSILVKSWNDMMTGQINNMVKKLNSMGKNGGGFFTTIMPMLANTFARSNAAIKSRPQDAKTFTHFMEGIWGTLQTSARTLFKRVSGGQDYGSNGFAKGGIMGANTLGLVGEQGPELFVPTRRGMIIPHSVTDAIMNSMGTKGGMATIININNPVVRDDRDIRKMAERVSAAQVSVLRSYGRR
jgi:hypothetical protein